MNVTLINNAGIKKECPTGFSWTTLFFGFFVPLSRGDLIGLVIHLIASILSVGIFWLVWPFIYNKSYINRLLEKGYMPYSEMDLSSLQSMEIHVTSSYESRQRAEKEKEQKIIPMMVPAAQKNVEETIINKVVNDFDFSNLISLAWPIALGTGTLFKSDGAKGAESLSCSFEIKNVQSHEILYTQWQLRCFDILKKPILTEIPVSIRHELKFGPTETVTVRSSDNLPSGTRSFTPYLKAVLYADQTVEEFPDDESLISLRPKTKIAEVAGFSESALLYYQQKKDLSSIPRFLYEENGEGVWTCSFCGTRNKKGAAECRLCSTGLAQQEICSKENIVQSFVDHSMYLEHLEEEKRKQQEEEERKRLDEEERKRIEEEELKAQEEKKAQEEREIEELEEKKRTARNKKIGLIAIIMLVLGGIGYTVWTTVLEDIYLYGKAKNLVASGNYYQGYTIYAGLGGYKDSKDQSLEALRTILESDNSSGIGLLVTPKPVNTISKITKLTEQRITGYQWLLRSGYPQVKVFESFAMVLARTPSEEDRTAGWRWLDSQGYVEAKPSLYKIARGMVEAGRYYAGYELYGSLGSFADSKDRSFEAYRGFLELDSSAQLRIDGYQWLLDNGYAEEKVFESFTQVLADTESEQELVDGWRWLDSKGYAGAKESMYILAKKLVESGDPYHGYQALVSLGDYKNSKEIVKNLATARVALDLRGGKIQNEPASLDVVYSEAYGLLPVPIREWYIFYGWYASLDGKDIKIDSATKVNIWGNHTLYAKWLSLPMILVQGGTFQMGSISGDSDEKPVHSVTVGSFYMGTYEITQGIYEQVMGRNPSKFKGARLPVEQVSWYDAVAFANALSRRDGLQEVYTINGESVSCDWGKRGYRLPTEAEWEYAARGGSKSQGYMYSGSNMVGDVAWYWDNSGSKTHDTGSKNANELGLYDMSGNVREIRNSGEGAAEG